MPMERERRSFAQTELPQDEQPVCKAPNQPSRETLPSIGSVEQPGDCFTGASDDQHHDDQSVAQAADHEGPQNADGPSVESTMGRHETFKHASPVDAALLGSTSLYGLAHADPLVELGVQFDSFKARWDAYFARSTEPNFDGDATEEKRLGEISYPLLRQMADLRSRGLPGFDAKLRVVQHLFETEEDLTSELEQAETADRRMMYSIMRDLVKWRGKPDDPSSAYASGPKARAPAPARRDAEANALINAIEAAWADLATFEQNDARVAEVEAVLDRRDVLLDAANALPAYSRASRHAKALALAWIDYTVHWREGYRWQDYTTDGQLALAIGESFKPSAIGEDAGTIDHETAARREASASDALAALASVLLPLINEYEARWVRLRELHTAGEREAGDQPQGVGITDASVAWDKRCEEAWNANGYKAGRAAVAAIERRIEALVDPYLEQPAATLEGIALKMRLAAVFPHFEDAAKADLLRVQILPFQAAGEAS